MEGKFIINVKLTNLIEEEKLYNEIKKFQMFAKAPSNYNIAKK